MKIRLKTKMVIKSSTWQYIYVITVFYPTKHTDADLSTTYKGFRILKLVKHG